MPRSNSRCNTTADGLIFHDATADRWRDVEELFGKRGACGGCWCMVWRMSRKVFDKQKGAGNLSAFRAIVKRDATPGLLAYRDGVPVGWCAVAPREDYPALARSRILQPVDDEPVWSVSCLYIAKDARRQGLSVALLRAAVDFVRRRGGRIVEGYPVEPKADNLPAAFAWTGTASAFQQAGYVECARRSPTRPIMRYNIHTPIQQRKLPVSSLRRA